MARPNASELRQLSDADLTEQIVGLRRELFEAATTYRAVPDPIARHDHARALFARSAPTDSSHDDEDTGCALISEAAEHTDPILTARHSGMIAALAST